MSNLNVNNITPIVGVSGTIGVSGSLIVTGNISSSGYVSASAFSGDGSGLTNVSSLITEWDGTRNGDAEITGSLVLSGSGITSLNVLGEITASGNISSSGNINGATIIASNNLSASNGVFGSQVNVNNQLALSTDGSVQGRVFGAAGITNIQIGRNGSADRNIELLGPVTASGNISASGTIIGSNLSGTNTGDITLTGTPDYITISNQVITRNQIDLANDVTGVLPSANLDADTAHLTTDQTFSGNKTFSAAITASGNISSSGVVTAASIASDATFTVAQGGTGATSFADKAVIITQDSGTDTLAAAAMDANGELLIGGTDGPAVATLTAGNGIAVTNANGGITIATNLTAGDGLTLNTADFDIDAAQTTITSVTNTGLKVGRGTTDTYIDFGTDDKIQLKPANSIALEVETTGIAVTGEITASGNISSSGTVSAAAAVLTTADINGGTVDGITSLTAAGDLDIGAHELRAETFQSDIATGTAPFTVASTTAVTNLQSATATTLHTARNINGVSFNGSANITVTAAGSTLSDTVTVAKGGTGATSFADKSVIITQDSGTDTLAAVAMSTNGQLLIGGTNGPAVAVPTGGDGLTVTVGDGTLEYDLDASLTTVTSVLAEDLVLGEDAQTKIDFETADEIHFYANNAQEMVIQANVVAPGADDGTALGDADQRWSDLFLAEGGVINFDAGDVTITQTGNVLDIAGTTDTNFIGNISSSGQVYDGTYHQWEVSVQADTDDDTNWQGPPTTGLIGATTWAKDFGTEYNGTSNIVQTRTNINTGWRIPHGANYSASIKSIDVYVGGATNATIDASDHLSASLWYSTAADVDERLNQTGTTGITQRHGGTVITTQVGQTLVKFNNYLISQSINVDLAPGAMLWPRVKMAEGSSQNLLWNIYYIVHYCKKPL